MTGSMILILDKHKILVSNRAELFCHPFDPCIMPSQLFSVAISIASLAINGLERELESGCLFLKRAFALMAKEQYSSTNIFSACILKCFFDTKDRARRSIVLVSFLHPPKSNETVITSMSSSEVKYFSKKEVSRPPEYSSKIFLYFL